MRAMGMVALLTITIVTRSHRGVRCVDVYTPCKAVSHTKRKSTPDNDRETTTARRRHLPCRTTILRVVKMYRGFQCLVERAGTCATVVASTTQGHVIEDPTPKLSISRRCISHRRRALLSACAGTHVRNLVTSTSSSRDRERHRVYLVAVIGAEEPN
jgi:hypothetical protein